MCECPDESLPRAVALFELSQLVAEVKDACGAFAGSSEQASPLRVEEESSLLMHIFLAPLW
jgi:hypothetical protein